GVRGTPPLAYELSQARQVHALVLAARGVDDRATLEAPFGDRHHALGYLGERPASEHRAESVAPGPRSEFGDLVVGPSGDQGLGLGERGVVVEDAGPQRGQRAREIGR